jgi:hypothetical protein
MTGAPTAETFTQHVGKPISLADGHKLTLVEIKRPGSPAAGAAARDGGFTLILRGPRAPVATEGMHRLDFESGKSFDLYLIPIHTASRDHQDYQIVFN